MLSSVKRSARESAGKKRPIGKNRIDAVRELFQADGVREVFQEWGRSGGKIRAKGLTAERRREIARKAARARWGRRATK